MPFRAKFIEALTLLATAAARMESKGLKPPILVGGAAVELYTGGAVTSGDFDFVSNWQGEFFAELQALGFERPTKPGWLYRSLLHRELDFGVQVVSNPLMDGHTDPSRIKVIDLEGYVDDKPLKLQVIPVEDLIADRIAQALSGSRIEKTMQNQAVRLYQLADSLDNGYLDSRIQTETGNAASLETLVGWVKTCGS